MFLTLSGSTICPRMARALHRTRLVWVHGFYRFHITLILTLTLTLKRAPKHFLGELFSKKYLGKFQQLTHSIRFNGRTFNAHNSGTVRRRHLKTRSVGHNSSTLNTPDLSPSLYDLPLPRYTLCIFHRFESAISRERKLVATGRQPPTERASLKMGG